MSNFKDFLMNLVESRQTPQQKPTREMPGPRATERFNQIMADLDGQIEAINAQIKQLAGQREAIHQKKVRITKGLGGGWGTDMAGNSNVLMGPHDLQASKNRWSRRPEPRYDRLVSANDDIQSWFGGDRHLYDWARRIGNAEEGESFQLPKTITPSEAQTIVDYLIGDNDDYRDFDIYSYDRESHSIHHGYPSDI